MKTLYFVDASGRYLGAYQNASPPEGAVEVPAPPADGRSRWTGAVWVADAVVAADAARAALAELDLKSIRSMREYIATKADAPALLKNFETAAAAERSKLV